MVFRQMTLRSSIKAIFNYTYHAVTSQSDGKRCVFPRFPQLSFGLTTVDSVIDLVSNFRKCLSSLDFVRVVASNEPCPITMFSSHSCAGDLREGLVHRVQLLAEERSAFAQVYAERLRDASSFVPPPLDFPSFRASHHRRSRRREIIPSGYRNG